MVKYNDMGVKLFPLLKMALLWKRLPSTQSEHLTEATGENDKQGVGSLKPYFDEIKPHDVQYNMKKVIPSIL